MKDITITKEKEMVILDSANIISIDKEERHRIVTLE